MKRFPPRKFLLPALAGLAALLLFIVLRPGEGMTSFTSGNGRLEATEVDVTTRMAGRVSEIQAREGDSVARGQILARLDLEELQAQARESRAQLAQANAASAEARTAILRAGTELKLAEASLTRTRQLVARGFVSSERLDRDASAAQVAESAQGSARSRLHQAEAAIQAARARVERMEVLLADGSLKAPIAGRVLYRLVEPGEVLPSGGKLLTLLDLSDLYMTAFLPAELAGRLSLGDEARIVLDALPERPIPARVTFVADKAQFTPREVETRTEREKLMFRVRVKVDPGWAASNAALAKPGMPGVAWFRLDPRQSWPQPLPRR